MHYQRLVKQGNRVIALQKDRLKPLGEQELDSLAKSFIFIQYGRFADRGFFMSINSNAISYYG